MKIYRKIENQLASLKDATTLTIKGHGVSVTFNGLNSPYVSHQACDIDTGHNVDELIVLSNRHAWLAVVPCHMEGGFEGNIAFRRLPAEYLRNGLFRFPAIMPGWLEKAFLVSVAVKDNFNGYDEEGNPKFKACISGAYRLGVANLSLFEEDDRTVIFENNSTKWLLSLERQELSLKFWHARIGGELPPEMSKAYNSLEDCDALDAELRIHGLEIRCNHECPVGLECKCTDCPYDNRLSLLINCEEANE